jgi:hypothetical protein
MFGLEFERPLRNIAFGLSEGLLDMYRVGKDVPHICNYESTLMLLCLATLCPVSAVRTASATKSVG